LNAPIRNGLFLICWLIFAFTSLQAQNTGKIAGRVTDSATQSPLIGVNVVIKNTLLGAATDENGWYVILNVPPGKYQLNFNYIGYQILMVENVVVNMGRTTKIDARLNSTVMDLGETVTVTAERPIVEIDKTSSSVHYEAAEVENLPVENLRNVLELSPGIHKNPDGTLSIRGGGAYEINYSINGIKSMTTNSGVPAYGTGTKSENSWKYDINPLAISQMEVITRRI